MPLTYQPFESLLTNVWHLSADEYRQLIQEYKKATFAANDCSMTWVHPIHPSFRTCLTLVVLHTNEVMGDQITDLLYESLFSARAAPTKVFSFKRSWSLWEKYFAPKLHAYRVKTSTEFVSLASSGPNHEEHWPAVAAEDDGRVVFFVQASDLPDLERELARRRGAGNSSEEEAMFVHRCVHFRTTASLTLAPTDSVNLTFLRPLVTHTLNLQCLDAVYPADQWIQEEKKQLASFLTRRRPSALDPLPLPPPLLPAPASRSPEWSPKRGRAEPVAVDPELRLILDEIGDVDIDGFGSPVAAAAVALVDPEIVHFASSSDNKKKQQAPTPRSTPFQDDPETMMQRCVTRSASITPTLAAMTATLRLSQDERLEYAKISRAELVVQRSALSDAGASLNDRANLELLLRDFFAAEDRSCGADSLDLFMDLKTLIPLVEMSPLVTVQYYNTDPDFFERWMFAVFLASRSFFHMLHMSGMKRDTYLCCSPRSIAATKLMVAPDVPYSSVCGGNVTWACVLCKEITPSETHVLPLVEKIMDRERDASLPEAISRARASRCSICMRSLTDYLADDKQLCVETVPFWNTLMFAQVSCLCLERDFCLACLAKQFACANLRSDSATKHERDQKTICLCHAPNAADLAHFNVLTRGRFASSSVLMNMQLRLCYLWFRQLRHCAQPVSYRNVILWLYLPGLKEEPFVTASFRNGEIMSALDLAVNASPSSDDRVTEIQFCACLSEEDIMAAIEDGADTFLSSESGTRLRVVCCRLPAADTPDVSSVLARLRARLVRRPVLALVTSDQVLRLDAARVQELYAPFEFDTEKTVLYGRCTTTGALLAF